MTRAEKLLKRFLSRPKDFSYDELKKLLDGFGYEEMTAGRTSGSRVAFLNPETMDIIKLHRPHPKPEMKRYQLEQVEEHLKLKGLIP